MSGSTATPAVAPATAPAELHVALANPLRQLHTVLSSSLLGIAPAFSAMLADTVQHGALVIFTEDCTGRPQKKAGDPAIIDAVSIAELDVVRDAQPSDGLPLWLERRTVGGAERTVAVWTASTGALLVLTDPVLVQADALVQADNLVPSDKADAEASTPSRFACHCDRHARRRHRPGGGALGTRGTEHPAPGRGSATGLSC